MAGEEDWGEASTAFDAPQSSEVKDDDPWEDINRKIFAFNETLDKYALKPAAKGYRKATPGWFDDTVTRFFENLRDFRSGLNSVLQWRWGHAGHNFGRFTVNSTLGIGGLFDVASKVDLDKHNTDLGLTFARWGIPEGNYLVLPFWGPSTVRDAAAIIFQQVAVDIPPVSHLQYLCKGFVNDVLLARLQAIEELFVELKATKGIENSFGYNSFHWITS